MDEKVEEEENKERRGKGEELLKGEGEKRNNNEVLNSLETREKIF